LLVQLRPNIAIEKEPVRRFRGQVFTMFLERGNLRDVEACAERRRARRRADLQVNHNTLSITCTVGLAESDPLSTRWRLIAAAKKRIKPAARRRQRAVLSGPRRSTARATIHQVWVTDQTPDGETVSPRAFADRGSWRERKAMLGTVIRMVDAQGRARGTRISCRCRPQPMLRAIDRWVIGDARVLRDAAGRHRFVKLSASR
jgi:hypothetical protein